MAQRLNVLMLDDGELDDVQRILQELGVAYGRVRGAAIVDDMPAPGNLLVATPRRIDSISKLAPGDATPIRIMVASEDSKTLRAKLRNKGFDYLVRRPVHPEALRLLLLRALYRGEERRAEARVPIGTEVSFRTGLLPRRATLADLSPGGCRLLSDFALESGNRVRLQIPPELAGGEGLALPGRIIRVNFEERDATGSHYSAAVSFEELEDGDREALEEILARQSSGPVSLEGEAAETPEVGRGTDGSAAKSARGTGAGRERLGSPGGPPRRERYDIALADLVVDVRMDEQGDAEKGDQAEASWSSTTAESGDASLDDVFDEGPSEKRATERRPFDRKVAAFGNRALRVLVGRDLSRGGMRIDRLPEAEPGDRLHLAIYGEASQDPFLVWATVARDDGENGMGLTFDPLDPHVAEQLEQLVASLPAVEDLHDGEARAMGTVVSEILDH